MPEGRAKRFPPLLFWVTPVLQEHAAGGGKLISTSLDCANVLENYFSRLFSSKNDLLVTLFGFALSQAK